MDIIQGSAEWKLLRLGKITASRINDVVAQIKTGEAASRADYRIELVTERLTGLPTDSFTNADMERGTYLEPFARSAYEVKKSLFVEQVSFIQHPKILMAGASPDGLVEQGGLIEIKCPKPKTHIATILSRKAPSKYINQMQWQMACTGRQWCDFVSYCPELPENLQLFIHRVNRDDELISELEQKVSEFDKEIDDVIKQLKSI